MKNSRAYTVYLVYQAVTSLLMVMVFTVNLLYQVSIAKLDPFQLVIVGTALELSIFLLEIPTGIVADLFSRRLSVIIGVFLIGIGFIVEGSWTFFSTILLAQIVWGAGYTFTSGAVQAWISDEIGVEQSGTAFMRGAQFSQLGAFIGILTGMLMGIVQLSLPIVAGGIFMLAFGIVLIALMPEEHFHSNSLPNLSVIKQIYGTFQDGVKAIQYRPALINLLWIGIFLGLYSEGFDRLWTASMLERFEFMGFQPIVWFGINSAISMLLTAGVTEILQRKMNMLHAPNLAKGLITCVILLLCSLLGFVLINNLWISFAILWLINILRKTIDPLFTTLINQRLEPQIRATVLSMSSQMDAIGQIIGGPLVGVIARQISISVGLLGSVLLLTPILGFFKNLMRLSSDNTAFTPQD